MGQCRSLICLWLNIQTPAEFTGLGSYVSQEMWQKKKPKPPPGGRRCYLRYHKTTRQQFPPNYHTAPLWIIRCQVNKNFAFKWGRITWIIQRARCWVFLNVGILDPVTRTALFSQFTANIWTFWWVPGLGINSGFGLYSFDKIFWKHSVMNRTLGWLGGSCYLQMCAGPLRWSLMKLLPL